MTEKINPGVHSMSGDPELYISKHFEFF